jgi:hypothetical protein
MKGKRMDESGFPTWRLGEIMRSNLTVERTLFLEKST